MLPLVALAAVAGRAVAADGDAAWPMWGGRPARNMVSTAKGLPTSWDVKTKKNVKWVAALGSQTYGNPVVSGGMVFVGTNNEGLRDPKQAGDRGVRDGLPRVGRRVPVAEHAREAGRRPRERLALPGRRQLPARRGRPRLLRQQPRRARLPRHPGLPRRGERRARHRREADGRHRRRRGLEVRHDGGGRRVPAQPRELVARSPAATSSSSARRTGRTRATSTSRRRARPRSSRSTRRPGSSSGRTTPSSTRSCTASGPRRPSARSAASCR